MIRPPEFFDCFMNELISTLASVVVLVTLYVNILQNTIGMEVKTERDRLAGFTSRHGYKLALILAGIYYAAGYATRAADDWRLLGETGIAVAGTLLFWMGARVVMMQSSIIRLKPSELASDSAAAAYLDGVPIGDLHYIDEAGRETDAPIVSEECEQQEFGLFELKRAQMWISSSAKFFAAVAAAACLVQLAGIPPVATLAAAVAVTFGFIVGKRLQLPEIYVIYLPEDYTKSEAETLSDNLTNFIGYSGDWIPVARGTRRAGRLLRHRTSPPAGEDFYLGDLFITTRLVALDPSNAATIHHDEEKKRIAAAHRWSIMLWGRRDIAAQAAHWIGKVVGIG